MIRLLCRAWGIWLIAAAFGVALASAEGVSTNDPFTGAGLGVGGLGMAAAIYSLSKAVEGLQRTGLRHTHNVRIDAKSARQIARLISEEVTLEDEEDRIHG